MLHLPVLLVWLFHALLAFTPAADPKTVPVDDVEIVVEDLYTACGLVDEMDEVVFRAGEARLALHGEDARILAIADMSQPSTAKRLYIIDLQERRLLLRTYVAHGQNSGGLMASDFSNENGSHKTSLGLYRVGEKILSPKHGDALLLYGLDKGLNCQALPREVIMHGADYVSEDFILANGRLGRSWGCPAVSREDMPRMIEWLAGGGLLYVHA